MITLKAYRQQKALRETVLKRNHSKGPLMLTRQAAEVRQRILCDCRHKAVFDYLIEASESADFTRMVTVTARNAIDSIGLQSTVIRAFKNSINRHLYGCFKNPPLKYLIVIEGFDYGVKPDAKHFHALITEPVDQRKVIEKAGMQIDVLLDLTFARAARRSSRGYTDAAGNRHPSLISNVDVRPVYNKEGIIDYLTKEMRANFDRLDVDYLNSNVFEREQ